MHSSIFYYLMFHLNSFALSHVKSIITKKKTENFAVKSNKVLFFYLTSYLQSYKNKTEKGITVILVQRIMDELCVCWFCSLILHYQRMQTQIK